MDYIRMNEDHVQQIADLEKVCFSDPWSVNSIRSELQNKLSLWIVAVEDDKLAGYVGSQSVLGWADMMNLAVSPEYRQRGIGEKLVSELIAKLKEDEVTCLTLEVRASNENAISLYEKCGFKTEG